MDQQVTCRLPPNGNGTGTPAANAANVRDKELVREAFTVVQTVYKAISESSVSLSFTDPEVARDNAMALAGLIRGWDTALERLRILRGKPLPGSKRPAAEPPKRLKRWGPRARLLPPPVEIVTAQVSQSHNEA